MSPRRIVAEARRLGLSVVGLADHNSARNAPALRDVSGGGNAVTALYGLEVRSSEEVDLLCVFDTVDDALAFGEWVYARLPEVACDAKVFGDQVVVDGDEEILGFEDRLLINGIAASLGEVADEARARGALVIPAHVDRATDSVISQLGWLPDDLVVDAVEVTRFGDEEALAEQHRWLTRVPVVRFSDAHRPEDIGYQTTAFHLAEVTVAELRAALAGAGGRWHRPIRAARAGEGEVG